MKLDKVVNVYPSLLITWRANTLSDPSLYRRPAFAWEARQCGPRKGSEYDEIETEEQHRVCVFACLRAFLLVCLQAMVEKALACWRERERGIQN